MTAIQIIAAFAGGIAATLAFQWVLRKVSELLADDDWSGFY